jgi:hypothetical protein
VHILLISVLAERQIVILKVWTRCHQYVILDKNIIRQQIIISNNVYYIALQ